MPVSLATLYPYKLEFDATITHINDDGTIELNQTYFYATSGGQPHDTGILKRNDEEFKVIDVRMQDGHIVHAVDHTGLAEGDAISSTIDVERREKHRRMHTATHVLCAVLEKNEGVKITGNQIGADRTRIDVNMEQYDPEKITNYIDEANQELAKAHVVKKYVIKREELLQHPHLIKLAAGFPEHVTEVHMVDINGFDVQPCGGTHVDNTNEIGKIVLDKAENRGKNNRRIYFHLE